MEETTKRKIILATLKLMGQRQGNDISVRDILKKAGMANMSAISYHFGSKDNLLKEALRWYYEELYKIIARYGGNAADGREKLAGLASEILGFISQNPGLEKTMLTRMIMTKKPDKDFQNAAGRNLSALREIIKSATGITDDAEAIHRVVIFMSGIIYPFLMGHYGNRAVGLDDDDQRHIAPYLRSLVECVTKT